MGLRCTWAVHRTHGILLHIQIHWLCPRGGEQVPHSLVVNLQHCDTECILVLIALPGDIKKVIKATHDDPWVFFGPHHGVRLATASLPVGKHTYVVAVDTRRDQWFDLRENSLIGGLTAK